MLFVFILCGLALALWVLFCFILICAALDNIDSI